MMRGMFVIGVLAIAAVPRAAVGQVASIRAQLDAPGASYQEDTRRCYEARGDAPFWLTPDQRLSPAAYELADVLASASEEGLEPSAYGASQLHAALQADSADGRQIDVDLTDAFIRYAGDVAYGRVRASTLHPGWVDLSSLKDVCALLDKALRARVRVVLEDQRPSYAGYEAVRKALRTYREIERQGGWGSLDEGPGLVAGDASPRVAHLRRRLRITGDLDALQADSALLFDADVERAVQRFQRRHGLAADGIVGPQTRAALNVPVEARIRQIDYSLERWRWLPHDPPSRYLLVNTAGGRLVALAQDTLALRMKVVVGKRSTPTPLFHSQVTGLVLAPYWRIPHSIAVREMLPAQQRDAGYLRRHHIRVFQGGRALDPASVDWASVTPRTFRYTLRQDPGPANPLGRLKFVVPNPFGIGLHDTPERHLFEQPGCTFSHGCIRLEAPMDLARFVLRADTAWTAAKIEETIAAWREVTIPLAEPTPIYVLYWTAWVEDDGTVHFRDDVYGYDRLLGQALRR